MDTTTTIRDALLALDHPFYRDAPLTAATKQDLQEALKAVLPATIDPYSPSVWQVVEDCLTQMVHH
ncbi:MAG: hypothetical protein LKJ69_11485 [Lactobacillus sp.]|jgi:hypothetical protein|nr:hypothetical protein [Lactobacillus sp.]MCI2033986.1 hypothetical protein [Lactobacillus sp.]